LNEITQFSKAHRIVAGASAFLNVFQGFLEKAAESQLGVGGQPRAQRHAGQLVGHARPIREFPAGVAQDAAGPAEAPMPSMGNEARAGGADAVGEATLPGLVCRWAGEDFFFMRLEGYQNEFMSDTQQAPACSGASHALLRTRSAFNLNEGFPLCGKPNDDLRSIHREREPLPHSARYPRQIQRSVSARVSSNTRLSQWPVALLNT